MRKIIRSKTVFIVQSRKTTILGFKKKPTGHDFKKRNNQKRKKKKNFQDLDSINPIKDKIKKI